MPEIRECIAHGQYVTHVWQTYADEDWTVTALTADGSDPETANNTLCSRRLKLGLVDIVDHDQPTFSRCWPKALPLPCNGDRRKMLATALKSLRLVGVSYDCRTLTLDLQSMYFQIQWLTHASPQFFTKEVWRESVWGINKKITWSLKSEPPRRHLCILNDFDAVLSAVARWTTSRRKSASSRQGLAIEVIRESRGDQGEAIWGGVGVYTATEIFIKAGIPYYITEKQLFDCPSRTARLIEALWQYAHISHNQIWKKVVRPAIKHDMLAPSDKQRKEYGRFLHVWSKKEMQMSQNHQLHKPRAQPDDIFDPFLIKEALLTPGHLGHLVFGKEKWTQLVPDVVLSGSSDDPVTKSFRDAKLLGAKSFLDLDLYETLEVEWLKRRKPTYTFAAQKRIWGLVPVPREITSITPITGAKREHAMLEYIVDKQRDVSIGPLEYCGTAIPLKSRDGRTTHVLASSVDPTAAPKHILDRYLRGVARHKPSASTRKRPDWQKGVTSKGSLTPALKEIPRKQIAAADAIRHRTNLVKSSLRSSTPSQLDTALPNTDDTNRAAGQSQQQVSLEKKRRRCADAIVVYEGEGRVASPRKRRRKE
ncbi:hypothetical protein PLICRDRAFT_33194 [Plicaturopsis crispa FD-325 SS-3]|uniref:Uncharacterized protein n=1 Tax=Plicaturopsis crispa FD-325 SS-3 TaxID=944288 RepID=A0A0C9SK01_PLICR|nr:hypothetical protein PLICRDRAFT_33194 [Plicaturopsis crispa FD-325 SS-3]